MPRSLSCPTCNAALPGAAVLGKTIGCDYCGNTVVVPDDAPAQPPPAPHPHPTFSAPPTGPDQTKLHRTIASGGAHAARFTAVGCSVVVGIAAVGVVGAIFLFGSVVNDSVADTLGGVAELVGGAAPGQADDNEVTRLGGPGTGVGLFDEAREVGVDGEGNIYVGEFTSRRVQRFSPDGEVSGQWLVDGLATVPLTGMTVARDGTVLVQVGFDVQRYHGPTGDYRGKVEFPTDSVVQFLTASAPLPDGGILVVHKDGAQEELVWLTAEGQVSRRVSPQVLMSPTSVDRLAVDGQGRIFALGRRVQETGVFIFDANGEFQSFFGGNGDGAGQFRLALGLAVDGQSRVAVSGLGGVQIFDSGGRFSDRLDVSSTPYGVTFDAQGRLWVATLDDVRAFDLQLAD